MNRSDPDRFDSRKWILGFFAIVLAAVLVLSVAAYAIDPFLQFRVMPICSAAGLLTAASSKTTTTIR